MKPAQSSDPQAIPLEEQLISVNAKTGLYLGARFVVGRAGADPVQGAAGVVLLPRDVAHLRRRGSL